MNVVERILSSDLYRLHAVQSALVANHSIFLKWSPIRSVQITGSSPILHAAGNCKNSQCTLSLSPKSDGLGFGTMRIYHYSGEYSYETAPTYFYFFLNSWICNIKVGSDAQIFYCDVLSFAATLFDRLPLQLAFVCFSLSPSTWLCPLIPYQKPKILNLYLYHCQNNSEIWLV